MRALDEQRPIVDLRTVEAAALAHTLDGLTAAMFLLDDDGRIVHANAAGHVMLADGSVISAAGGKLTVADQTLALFEMVMARASAIACGYQEAIDLDRLRHDPLMKVQRLTTIAFILASG